MNEPEWNAYLEQFSFSCKENIEIPKDTNKFCVIIEPRIHEKLLLVVKNFMYLLAKKGWGLIIFHGTQNESYVKSLNCENIIYINMQLENITSREYSDMLCSHEIWKTLLELRCKHALIFQTDTVLLKDTIDDFLEYDYVGAPWCLQWLSFLNAKFKVGNGGLSLRNVQKMYDTTMDCSRTISTIYGDIPLQNEDIYFSYYLEKTNANIPSIEVASKFSVETIYNNDTCGMHQPHLDKFPDRESFAKLLSKRYFE